jgi:hypothetical protein
MMKHLTYDDRRQIQNFLTRKCSFSEIGEKIGKDRTTISREVKAYAKYIGKSARSKCISEEIRQPMTTLENRILFTGNRRYDNLCRDCKKGSLRRKLFYYPAHGPKGIEKISDKNELNSQTAQMYL